MTFVSSNIDKRFIRLSGEATVDVVYILKRRNFSWSGQQVPRGFVVAFGLVN